MIDFQFNLKRAFKQQLDSVAVDDKGNPITEWVVDDQYRTLTRGDVIVNKCIERAQRGDMYAVKLIVDLVEPKELRIAIAQAVTIEHKLNDTLQAIIDKVLLVADNHQIDSQKNQDNKDKIDKSEGGVKNAKREG